MDPIKSLSNLLRGPGPEAISDSRAESGEGPPGIENPGPSGESRRENPSAGSRTRGALWRFIVYCTEPILSRLRDYFTAFVGDLTRSLAILIDLTRSANRRAAATWHSVAALQERTETLARREDVEKLALQVKTLASRSVEAHRLMEVISDRKILVIEDAAIVRTPSGVLLAPTDDLALIYDLTEGSPGEKIISELLDLTLKQGMTFVDVGAHLGLHVLDCARRVGSNGMVIAFEPTPKVFELLERSVHLNGLDKRCRCLNVAISSAEGRGVLHLAQHSAHNSLYQLEGMEEETTVEIRTASLDSLLRAAGRVDVVKIGVQGAELDVLEGMKQVLADHREILLIVEYLARFLPGLGIKPSDWFNRFLAFGFDIFSIDPGSGRWIRISEERASQLSSTVVVFVRPETSFWRILKQDEK